MAVNPFKVMRKIKGHGGGGPTPSQKVPTFATGMNVSKIYTTATNNPFWNMGVLSVPQAYTGSTSASGGTGGNIQGLNEPIASGVWNGTIDGNPVPDILGGFADPVSGVPYRYIKVDQAGYIYPDSNSSVGVFSFVIPQYYDPDTIPIATSGLDAGVVGLLEVSFGDYVTTATVKTAKNFTVYARYNDAAGIARGLAPGHFIIQVDPNVKITRYLDMVRADFAGQPFQLFIRPWNNPANYPTTKLLSDKYAGIYSRVAMYGRFLDPLSINSARTRGDTLTQFGKRSFETGLMQSGSLSHSQVIKWCKESNWGLAGLLTMHDDETYARMVFRGMATLDSNANCANIGSEVWNTAFSQGQYCALIGARLGYADRSKFPPTAPNGNNIYYSKSQIASLGLTPITIKARNFANEKAVSCPLSNGDNYFTTVNGLGWVVLKALENKNWDPIPTSTTPGSEHTNTSSATYRTFGYSSTTAYLAGDNVLVGQQTIQVVAQRDTLGADFPILWSSSQNYGDTVISGSTRTTSKIAISSVDGETYYLFSGTTSKGQEPSANPGVWRLATAADCDWLSATPARPNGAVWQIICDSEMTNWAKTRWLTDQTERFQQIANEEFDAVNKPRIRWGYNIRNDGGDLTSGIDSQIYQYMYWGNGPLGVWRLQLQAPYMGGQLRANNDYWYQPYGDPNNRACASFTPSMKVAAYAAGTDGDTAIATLLSQATQPDVMQAIAGAQVAVRDHQLPLIKDLITSLGGNPNGFEIHFYERGVRGNWLSAGVSSGSTARGGMYPELLAGVGGSNGNVPIQWSATKQYDPALPSTSFAWDGDDLYLCIAASLGIQPSTDPTKWTMLNKCTPTASNPAGRRVLAFFQGLIRSDGIGSITYRQDLLFEQTPSIGNWATAFEEQNDMPIGTFSTAFQTWGYHEVGSDETYPMWAYHVQTTARRRAMLAAQP